MGRPGLRHADPIIELNRWQLTGALLGLGLIVAVVFFAGVVVGRQSTAPLPPEVARIVASSPKPATTAHGDRGRVMAAVEPGTSAIDADLARPLSDVVPRDKADAARAETHRQLQQSRANGLAAAQAPPDVPRPMAVPPAPALASNPDGRVGFTLQVSAFEAREPALLVAAELEGAGHAATVREVRGGDRSFFRVEVGFFDTDAQAAVFQRRFERESALSTVRLPVP